MKKLVSGLLLFIFLTSTLTFALSVRSVSADGTIYIRADGSVDPSIAPILTLDNVTYTLTGNITSDADGIVVERDNIVLNGAGYNITGSGNGNGTTLTDRSKVTIRNITIKNFHYGIVLASSSSNTLSYNNVTANNVYGVELYSSSDNALFDNNVANNGNGIVLASSSDNNTLSGNSVANSDLGIYLASSSNNTLSGNNVANNYDGVELGSSDDNVLSGNNVTANSVLGIYLASSSNNTLSGNNVTANNGRYDAYGIAIDSSSDNTLSGNNVANNYNGIRFSSSDDNVLSGNNVTANSVLGIYLASSSNNTLFGNNVTATQLYGIELASSSSSTLSNNNVANNEYGITLYSSPDNVLFGNNVANNYDGVVLDFSSGNALFDNNVANNGYGIVLGFSVNNNVLFGNNITTNNVYGIALYSSDNSIFHNNFVGNSGQVLSVNSSNTWDDGYPSGGNYWSDYTGVDANNGPNQNLPGSDGIGDTPYIIDANNTDRYPLMNPWIPPEHDVAIINVSPLKTVVGLRYSLNVSVTTMNQGEHAEAFNVTVYTDTTIIASQNITLSVGNSTPVMFTWNTTGFAYGNYTISAYAWPVPGETNTANNNFTCSVSVHVGVPGDISGSTVGVYDRLVGMRDIAYLIAHFNGKPGDPKWLPNCDVNNDGVINMRDIAIAIAYFNQRE